MYRQMAIAAAAGLLSLAPLAVTPAAAATPRLSITLTATTTPYGVYGYRYQRPQLVCTPTYKHVTYRYHHHTYTRLVRTGQTCHWVYPSAPRPPGRRY